MPTKGMRNLLFHKSSDATSKAIAADLAATLVKEAIAKAEPLVAKWDVEGTTYAKITSLFYDSPDEARRFLLAVSDLHRYMNLSFASDHRHLVPAQRLVHSAMRRLQKEFYQILAANRDRLDPDSVSSLSTTTTVISELDHMSLDCSDEDEVRLAELALEEVERIPTAAMANLRSIADCMVKCGYAKECVEVYTTMRRSIVDEGIYQLGFQRLTTSKFQKMDWGQVELRIHNWLAASRVAVKTLFAGERVLSDYVFGSSDSIKASCFSEITRDAATGFLQFPEQVGTETAKAKKIKKSLKSSPEKKLFRFLDLFNTTSQLLPEITTVFSHDSTSAVRSQTASTMAHLAESIRSTLTEFETRIKNNNNKSVVPGGGVHPLTRNVIDNVLLLADYADPLADILTDTSVSELMTWLVLVLLCKLDGKAEAYTKIDVSLSYLFLSNNLYYIINKVKHHRTLSQLMGEEWIESHVEKARSFLMSYERLGWAKVVKAVSVSEEVKVVDEKKKMKEFNSAFESTVKLQLKWVMAEAETMEEVKRDVKRMVVEPYRVVYERVRRTSGDVVRYAPEDVENHIDDLFCEDSDTFAFSESSVRSSGSATSSRSSWWRSG